MSLALADLLEDPAAPALEVTGLCEDSRQVVPGDVFVAYRGAATDGHGFVADAVERGAVAVLAERALPELSGRVPVCVVADLRHRRGALAARLYGEPGRALHCVGVTGTNGKTSIAHSLADLASRCGRPAGYLGTIGWGRIGSLAPARLTTEGPITTQQRLAALRDDGCSWAVMEVSSHALAQQRVDDVPFRTALFSNLSRDHLDYHADAEAYAAAKARLFRWPGLELAVLNADDAFGRELAGCLPAGATGITYGAKDADVRWQALDLSSGAARGRWSTPWGEAPLVVPVPAAFAVANAAAALAALCHAGVPLDTVAAALADLAPVPGRMERFAAPGRPLVVVDFAHTPDALEKVLAALRPATAGRLSCVFGCGGDRDPGKRPLMAAAAEARADELWLTSDNPRSEDPDAIIEDMRAGLTGRVPARACADRRAAVTAAVSAAGPGDTVLVAGKGHEDYQEIDGRREPFSDRALVESLMREAC
jgi:UDP-N-acetylmuramoyl-L-alanyl-D-glutamate--2,6-diaminopimelate ligase